MAVALPQGTLEAYYNLDRLTEGVWNRLPKALVVGQPPPNLLGYVAGEASPYDAVIFGQLPLGQLLHFTQETALECLLLRKPVYVYEPGIPIPDQVAGKVLYRQLLAGREKLEQWGVVFYGGKRRFFTQERLKFYKNHGLSLPEKPIIL